MRGRKGPVDVDKLLRGILESYPTFQPPEAEIVAEGPFPWVLGNEACDLDSVVSAIVYADILSRQHVSDMCVCV